MAKKLTINRTKLLTGNQFYPKEYKKKGIIYHHTAGLNASGAIQWWNQTKEHVGTAYVIERDGTIYECFPPETYAYHLGIREDDNTLEKNTIGIEIVAGGQLYYSQSLKTYNFYPLYPNLAGGRVIPEKDVVILKKEFRGYRFFHKYTDEQIESTVALTNYLLKKFPTIEIQKDYKNFDKYNEKIWKENRPGIYAHTSVRKDKVDTIPQTNFRNAIIDNLYEHTSLVPNSPMVDKEKASSDVPNKPKKKSSKGSNK